MVWYLILSRWYGRIKFHQSAGGCAPPAGKRVSTTLFKVRRQRKNEKNQLVAGADIRLFCVLGSRNHHDEHSIGVFLYAELCTWYLLR